VIALQSRDGFVVAFYVCVFVAFIGYRPFLPFHSTQGSHIRVQLRAFYRECIPIYRQFLFQCSEWSVSSFRFDDRSFVHLINVPPVSSPFTCWQ